jgi:hypothetical protein
MGQSDFSSRHTPRAAGEADGQKSTVVVRLIKIQAKSKKTWLLFMPAKWRRRSFCRSRASGTAPVSGSPKSKVGSTAERTGQKNRRKNRPVRKKDQGMRRLLPAALHEEIKRKRGRKRHRAMVPRSQTIDKVRLRPASPSRLAANGLVKSAAPRKRMFRPVNLELAGLYPHGASGRKPASQRPRSKRGQASCPS